MSLTDIQNNLKEINSAFFNNISNNNGIQNLNDLNTTNYYLGGNISTIPATDNIYGLIGKEYDDAETTTANELLINPKPDTSSISDNGKIGVTTFTVANGNETVGDYTMYNWNYGTPSLSASPNDNTNKTFRDINCMWYYKGKISIVNYIQSLYAWHNLLIPSNWQKFISFSPVTIKVPDISSGTLNLNSFIIQINSQTNAVTAYNSKSYSETYDITGDIVNSLNSIIPLSKIIAVGDTINIYVLRRLFYLYIQLAQYRLGMGIIKASEGNDTNFSAAQNIVNNIQYNLQYSVGNNDAFNNLLNILENNATQYQSSTNRITNLNNNVTQQKTKLNSYQDKINSQTNSDAIVKKFEIAAIVILCIVLAFSVGLIIYPLEYTRKLTFGLIILVIAIVSSFIISVLYNRSNISTVEKFTAATNAADFSTYVSNTNTTFYGYANQYLQITIKNATALQSYQLYNNVNYSLEKESTYYNDTNNQLLNVNARMDSIYKMSFLVENQRTALINFLMSVTVISAATVMAYISVENYHTASKTVLIIGIILISISLILYILEISQRVRTDGDKIYWSHLSSDTANQLGN